MNEFKIGDRVETVRSFEGAKVGLTGTVRTIGTYNVGVEIDSTFNFQGRSLGGSLPNNSGYNIEKSCLVILSTNNNFNYSIY
jgi:hypothetical protein